MQGEGLFWKDFWVGPFYKRVHYNLIHRKVFKNSRGAGFTGTLQNETTSLGPQLSTRRNQAEKSYLAVIQWTDQECREHGQKHKRTGPFSKTLQPTPSPLVGGLTTYVQWEFKISMNHLEPYDSYSSHFEWECWLFWPCSTTVCLIRGNR